MGKRRRLSFGESFAASFGVAGRSGGFLDLWPGVLYGVVMGIWWRVRGIPDSPKRGPSKGPDSS